MGQFNVATDGKSIETPSHLPLTPPTGLSGQVIGPYRIVEKLGAGGMAEVYKAYQPRLDRYVALKFIRPDLNDTEEFLPRFEREAKLLAKLNHPHIVHIYDFGEQGRQPTGQPGLCYLVMEYVAGGTLKEWLRSVRQTGLALTAEQALIILEQVSTALDYAHQQGIIHRDIKPANVMLTPDGRALLSDFGIAKLISTAGDATQTGSTTGTPAYMSPEQISSPDKVGPPSDVYSLGVVLYEMLTGRTPFITDSPMAMIVKQVQDLPPPPRSFNPALPQAVDEVMLKVLTKDPAARYQRAGELVQAFQVALAMLSPNGEAEVTLLRGSWWPQWSDESPALGEPPFKGLQYFDEADADLFFGRELLTARLVTYLPGASSARFLAIIGASGSGKSSLVRAGLIPALRRGEPLVDGSLPPAGSAGWPIHVITPTAHPLESLAASLTRASESVTATATLMDDLARDPRSLHLYVRRLLNFSPAPSEGAARLLLVVDQFEELFTLCHDEAKRRAFVDNLLTAAGISSEPGRDVTPARDDPTLVIITLRADFYGHCAQFDGLREALARRQEYIGPMTPAELRRAIEEPARRGGWAFEPGLVDFLLEEVGLEPGALPLLSHALLETWQRRRGRTLTFGGYRASGGVRGAIAKTADRVWSQLGPEQQAIARNIFLRLTELGEGTQDTRRRVSRAEVEALTGVGENRGERPVAAVLHTLADARLITTGEDTVEVAHEALIREWPLLRQWLDENRAGLYLHRHLTEAAQAWEKLDRDPGELYRGARLAQASEWAQSDTGEMNALEREFLAASQEAARQREAEREAQRQRELEAAQRVAEAEQRRAEEQGQAARRLRQRAVFLTGALVIAAILAVAAIVFGQQAGQNERRAQAEANNRATAQANAEMQQQEAERQTRMATSRELAAAAVNNLEIDPERSILLALQAVTTTYPVDGLALPEALDALHQTLPASRVRLTLTGHTDIVYRVSFSPDDTHLATSDVSGVSKVWDAVTGQELFTAPGHDAAFSQDDKGKHLVTLSPGKVTTITTWNVASGQVIITMPVKVDTEEKSFALSPDQIRLIVEGPDWTLNVWDATTSAAQPKPLFRLVGHTDEVSDLAFSQDGTHWVTASYDGTARIWDVNTGKLLFTLTGHMNGVRRVAFRPDGRYLATKGEDATVRIWEVATGREQLNLPTGSGWDIAFSQDGLQLATVQANEVEILDLSTAFKTETSNGLNADTIKRDQLWLKGHPTDITTVAFNSTGTRLISAGFDGTARVWDISPTGAKEWLTLAGHTSNFHLNDVEFSPDGTRLATASVDHTAKIWDAVTGQELLTLAGHTGPVNEVTFSPDGTRLATVSADHTAKIWDALTGRELTLHPDSVADIAFSPDGTRLATTSTGHTAKIWDALTGQDLFTLAGHTDFVSSVDFSPDGTRLATGSDDEMAKIWDTSTGQELLTLTGHSDFVNDVAFSPDGTRLATASNDGLVKLWQVETGQELFTLTRDQYTINEIAFSPDGTRLVAGSNGWKAIMWSISGASDTGTTPGQELLTLPSAGNGVAFSPDGRLLATTGMDNDTLRVYILPIDELIPLARSRLTRTWRPDECRQYLHQETCPAWP